MTERRGNDCLITSGPFYTTLAAADGWKLQPGQLYYAHTVYPTAYPRILRIDNLDPRDDPRKASFTLKDFSDPDASHYPSKELGLEHDELYYACVGKRRLVIVLGECTQTWYPTEREQRILLCAPVFSFKRRHLQEVVIPCSAWSRGGRTNQVAAPGASGGCVTEAVVAWHTPGSRTPKSFGLLSR